MFESLFYKVANLQACNVTKNVSYTGVSLWNLRNSEEHLFWRTSERLLLWAVYKTKNTGTGNWMRGMRGTWGMLTRIPGNLIEDFKECYYFNTPGNVKEDSGEFKNIPGNVWKDSGECSRRFRGMFKKIPGNVREHSEECLGRFRGMFKKIPGNVSKNSGECWQRFGGMLVKILENAQKDWTLYNAIKRK